MRRTLIIGVANQGMRWAKAIKAHPKFGLAGLADIDADVLARRSAEFSIPTENQHSDHREALSSGRYDVVVIAVPNHLHYPVAKDVLNANLHCLLEKPFAETLEHAVELVELAEKKKVVLEIGQNYRFLGLCLFIDRFIAEQRLGRLGGVEASFHLYRPPRYEHERVMAFPMLYLQAIHHLDWLITILPSPIKEVIGRHQRVPWSMFEQPSICHIILRCEDGALTSYRGSYESRGNATPYLGSWRFEFERGDLIVDRNSIVWQITEYGKKREKVFEPEKNEKSGESWLLDGLYEAVTNGTEPPTSGRRNLKTLELLLDIMENGSAD